MITYVGSDVHTLRNSFATGQQPQDPDRRVEPIVSFAGQSVAGISEA
jgi:hypothetical protein